MTPPIVVHDRPLPASWNFRIVESFAIDRGVTRTPVADGGRPVELGDLGPSLKAFSGTIAYATHVSLEKPEGTDALWLDLGDVKYAAAVYLNCRLVGRRAWSPYVFDLTSFVVPGENVLEVHVTGTLAAAWVDAVRKMDPAWRNMYVEKVEPWAGETSGIGLLGPVTLKTIRTRSTK